MAALFALHPLHVESVAWVAERKDVLSVFFLLTTLWAYAWYVARPGTWRYLLVFVFLRLGAHGQAHAVTLPFVLLLLDYWPLGRWPARPAPAAGKRKAQASPALAPGAAACRLVWEKVPLFALAGRLLPHHPDGPEKGHGPPGGTPLRPRLPTPWWLM